MVELPGRVATDGEDGLDVRALASALSAAERKAANLEIALGTARRIGMALGILMARHGWTEEAAFEAIRSQSQRVGRKARDIAEDVILTGDLPPDP